MSGPDWLDREAYPFAPHWFEAPAGRMHYVDEGDGPPVLMLHGNPTWSFLYRHLIRGLSQRHRCIAPDYLGFGLSEKPPLRDLPLPRRETGGVRGNAGRDEAGKPRGWRYLPADHAACVASLADALDLEDVTLVVQDWGGPIGLAWALEHPERVRRLVILNTWMWPVRGDLHFEAFSRLLGGPVGRELILRLNVFARVVMPAAYADRRKLTRRIYGQYLAPLARPGDRVGSWVFPREIVGSSDWLAGLWARRDRLRGTPAAIVWGMKDPAFRPKELARWELLLPEAPFFRLPDVGHYVQEEMGRNLTALLKDVGV